ncbi:contact-dependent growth inhibition system immunity protein [Paraburkholderia sp.]|uniref:contact-dependent growth inhibition system immunity protein n=1 Tax=Paraburkholderia sp. TaxID=1926495 RepID=UPI0039E2FEEB
MENESPYPNLDLLIHGYFNQDFDLWGDNVQEIISCFKEENDQTLHTLITGEIDRFKRDHSANLDEYFEEKYGFYVDPEPWGYTIASFLDELKRLLSE